MGGFDTPTPVQAGGQATTYYTTGSGANFGGYCTNAACPSQGLENKAVSHCAGMVDTNPYMVDSRCRGCNNLFVARWLWFSSTRVTLRKMGGAPEETFECRGNDNMRRVILNHSQQNDCVGFVTAPL